MKYLVEPIRKKEDIEKIENYLKKHNKRNLLLFTIGINTGLKISDLVSLNVEDVRGKEYIQIRNKRFPINSKLKLMIDNYTKDMVSDDPLFITKFGNRLNRFGASYIIKSTCETLKIKEKVGTETMRKTFGYHYYKKYKDIAMLQKIFNHADSRSTLKYIGMEQEEIDNSLRNFELGLKGETEMSTFKAGYDKDAEDYEEYMQAERISRYIAHFYGF